MVAKFENNENIQNLNYTIIQFNAYHYIYSILYVILIITGLLGLYFTYHHFYFNISTCLYSYKLN